MRRCRLCGKEKSLEEFYKGKRFYRSRCKECDNDDAANRYKNLSTNQKSKRYLYYENKYRKTGWYRNYKIQKTYGITSEEYDKLREEQDNLCAICKIPNDKPLHLDHCHKTNKIRKFLCSFCNTGIGLFHDDPELLNKAILYLRQHD